LNNLVSIIIPCYNKATFLAETLQAVLNQTFTDWECILVDDGSTDETPAVAKAYLEKDTRFRYFLKKNEGVSTARNFGLKKAQGDFVIFLDADDILADFSLAKRLDYFSQYPEQDGLVFSTHFFEYDTNNPGNLFNCDPEIESERKYLEFFLNYQFVWQTTSPIWKRSVLEKVQFRDELRLLEDIVLNIEILFLQNIKIKRIHLVDNYYRVLLTKKYAFPGQAEEMTKSVLFLLKTYQDKIGQDVVLQQKLSRFVKIVYRIVVVGNEQTTVQKELYARAKLHKYIKPKEQFLFSILYFIYKWKLDSKRNIGMYRLIRTLDNKLLK
jgi:glycosyltransferase involved in cell wall biosynthesis